jgi:predicted RecB family endonuclease
MSASQRAKGRRGQSEAVALLESRDWLCGDLSAGISSEDILAVEPGGRLYSVEVKSQMSINVPAFRSQAIRNAAKRKKSNWMVMARIDGYSGAWLVLRAGMAPVVWSAN